MINNSLLLIIVTLAYAGYNLFIKLAGSQNINNSNGSDYRQPQQHFPLRHQSGTATTTTNDAP